MKNRRILSFRFAYNGIVELIKTQANFRIHLVAGVVMVFAGLIFNITATEWIFLIFCIGLMLTMETLNTAIEYIVNFISPEYHELAGKIKDIAAAAVLISAISVAVIGLIIFSPYVFDFLF